MPTKPIEIPKIDPHADIERDNGNKRYILLPYGRDDVDPDTDISLPGHVVSLIEQYLWNEFNLTLDEHEGQIEAAKFIGLAINDAIEQAELEHKRQELAKRDPYIYD